MKKYILSMIIAVGFGMSLSAQQFGKPYSNQTDGFFSSNRYEEYREDNVEWGKMPLLPKTHGYNYDYDAEEVPLGSGLLLLAGMGIGYAVRKRKNNDEE